MDKAAKNSDGKPKGPSAEQKRGGFGMTPTTFILGEELIAIVRLLSAINENLAVIARVQQCLIFPELKDKLFLKPKKEEKESVGQVDSKDNIPHNGNTGS